MGDEQNQATVPMCSICHSDSPINGIQLKCGHVFCYLCIKNHSEIYGNCALCRADIGFEFNFQEHNIIGTMKLPVGSTDGNYWFYEGYRGWWLYDADTNRDIEAAYQRGEAKFEKFIAGSVYVIDFANLNQYRKDEADVRQRKICRATLELDNILGMAGLKGQDFAQALEMMRESQEHNYPAPPM